MNGNAFTGILLVIHLDRLREGEKGDGEESRGEADPEEVDGTPVASLENGGGHESEQHAGVAERPDSLHATREIVWGTNLRRPQRMRNESRRRRSSCVKTTRKRETLCGSREEGKPQVLDASPVQLERRQAEERTHVHRQVKDGEMAKRRGDESPDLSLLHDRSEAGCHAGHIHLVIP